MSAYTPGPWAVVPMCGYEKRGWLEVYASRTPVVAADAFTRYCDGESETHFGVRISPENALLIAQSPVLFASCESLLDFADHKPGCAVVRNAACDCGFDEALAAAKAALRAAKEPTP